MIIPVIFSRFRGLLLGFIVLGFGMVFLSCLTVENATANDSAVQAVQDHPRPDPALSPGEVVEIQLEALGSSEGIDVAFRFASPANKLATGPIHRFTNILRGPAYNIMLDYERIEYGPVIVQGNFAVQRVALYRGEELVFFDFHLRRQTQEPYVDCWMTEGVVRLEVRHRDPPDMLSV